MKTKFFTLFAAFALLFGAKAMAQTNGDVNDDGVVNEQDIAAILEIMAEAGGVKEQTKYYWYVGQENPASMTSISPIVDDNTSPGWREIGQEIPTYDKSNKLWDANNLIEFNEEKTLYIALPSDDIKSRNDISGADITTDSWTINPTKKNIAGVNYTIWTLNWESDYWGETLY